MKTYCIFDLDGTIADTLQSLAYSTNRALADVGLTTHPAEAFRRFAGDGVNRMVERSVAAAGGTAEQTEQARAAFAAYFQKDYFYGVQPFAGMPEALHALKASGKKLAVLSNKPHEQALEVVQKLYGETLFDCIVGQSAQVPCKPSPIGVQYILNQFGETPENGAYFGDTDTDMITGKGGGLFTVGVLWGFRGREELLRCGADTLIEQPSDIEELLRRA